MCSAAEMRAKLYMECNERAVAQADHGRNIDAGEQGFGLVAGEHRGLAAFDHVFGAAHGGGGILTNHDDGCFQPRGMPPESYHPAPESLWRSSQAQRMKASAATNCASVPDTAEGSPTTLPWPVPAKFRSSLAVSIIVRAGSQFYVHTVPPASRVAWLGRAQGLSCSVL